MSQHANQFGQPIGFPVSDWTRRPLPPRTPMLGRYCRLEPLDAERHAADLDAAYRGGDPEGRNWTYLPTGPYADFASFRADLAKQAVSDERLFSAIVPLGSGRALGVAAFLRMDQANGSIEVGSIHMSQALKQTRASTEAMFLMMARAFDELGYRRYEWKCDSLNAPSRAAALRYGFRYEGLFRQATVYKGRNRDTTWFAITDREWPAVKAAFQRWLDPTNFDVDGRQRTPLQARQAD